MYYIGTEKYTADPRTKLGSGSEGTVYPFPKDPKLCVKLFHPPDPDDPAGLQVAAYRARKVAAICELKLQLGAQFILPQTPVLDAKKVVIGFQMPRVPTGFNKLMKLLDQGFRTNSQLTLKEIIEFYARIFEDLAIIHGKGLSIGDINMGCLMFNLALERAWVDTDSWSYPGFPCVATTELFAHPDLYPNLKAGNKFVPPLAHHDRFAFTVLLTMMALPGAHPFRMGSHPTVRSLAERVERGITIFDNDVAYPKMLTRPEVLSDELLGLLIERLKRKTDEPLNPDTLRAFAKAVVQCKNCNTHYHASRTLCPTCQTKSTFDMTMFIELLIEELAKVPGQLLYAQVINDTMHIVCRVQDKVEIIILRQGARPRTIPTTISTPPGARYRFFENCLVICPNPTEDPPANLQIYRINGAAITQVADSSTMSLEGDTAVFDTSAKFLYRIAGNTLMRCTLFGNTLTSSPVAQVYQNQTWFTTDRISGAPHEIIFGYDRMLREWEWFVIKGNKEGTSFAYHKVGALPLRPREKLEDFRVYFNATAVLLVRSTRYQGRQFIRFSVIAHDGTVERDELVNPSDEGYEYWSNLHGKMLQGTSILHLTPNGVVKHDLVRNSYSLLKDTTGIVASDDALVRFGNKIGMVRRDGTILTLEKEGR